MTTSQMATRITELLYKADDYSITADELKELQKLLYVTSNLIDRDIQLLAYMDQLKQKHPST